MEHADGRKEGAVFVDISRFNHSCVPNAHVAWNTRLGMQTIHAVTEIPAEEEIVVSCACKAPVTLQHLPPSFI